MPEMFLEDFTFFLKCVCRNENLWLAIILQFPNILLHF